MPKIIDDPVVHILSYAKSLLFEEGYDAVNMRAIAKHCGIATGTIYNYFDKKEALMYRLMTDFWEELLDVMDDLDQSDADFYEKIEGFYLAFSDFTRRFHEVFIIPSVGTSPSQGMATASTKKNAFMAKLIKRLTHLIDNTQVVLPSTLTSKALAEHILANFIGIAYTEGYEYENFVAILKTLLRA